MLRMMVARCGATLRPAARFAAADLATAGAVGLFEPDACGP